MRWAFGFMGDTSGLVGAVILAKEALSKEHGVSITQAARAGLSYLMGRGLPAPKIAGGINAADSVVEKIEAKAARIGVV
jgi:hypothetical protein